MINSWLPKLKSFALAYIHFDCFFGNVLNLKIKPIQLRVHFQDGKGDVLFLTIKVNVLTLS